MSDAFGRPPIAAPIKRAIAEAFAAVPTGKRGALLVIADERGARMHLAAKVGNTWKVAAGGGRPWDGRPEGYIAVEASW